MPMEMSHIWLGQFNSEAALDEYFAEQYDNDDLPINSFAADQGKMYYDHDWVEREFYDANTIRDLVQITSFANDYLEEVVSNAEELKITSANTFILADANEFSNPKSIEGANYKLWYMGQFKINM